MPKEVVLIPLAEKDYERIIEYLINEWGVVVAMDFIARFNEVELLLRQTPEIFAFESRARRIQKCILTKHNILYFTVTATQIKIITIFDTRQDPNKLIL